MTEKHREIWSAMYPFSLLRNRCEITNHFDHPSLLSLYLPLVVAMPQNVSVPADDVRRRDKQDAVQESNLGTREKERNNKEGKTKGPLYRRFGQDRTEGQPTSWEKLIKHRERETLSTHVRFLSLSCRVCFIPPFVISVSVCLFLFSFIISLFVFFVVFERGIFFHSFLSFLFLLLLTYVFRWDYRFDRCVRERASAHGGAHERMDDESTGDVESGQASGRRVRLYNIPEMKKSDWERKHLHKLVYRLRL